MVAATSGLFMLAAMLPPIDVECALVVSRSRCRSAPVEGVLEEPNPRRHIVRLVGGAESGGQLAWPLPTEKGAIRMRPKK